MEIFLEYSLQTIAAFIATLAFCILFSVPRKQYFFCGLCGGVSWLVYWIFDGITGVVYATFFASVVIVLMSRIMAIMRKCPVSVFLITGIIPLVPGSAIYYTAYNLFMDEVSAASDYFFLTLKLAVAIVMGIVVVFAIPIKHSFPFKASIKKAQCECEKGKI